MAIESRSQNGCWTCRLRKRKCDEKVPICSECLGLRLDCHGYEERPTWMDRGAKQKAQATKIKQMVAKVRRQRRMDKAPNQGDQSNSRSQDSGYTSTTRSTSSTNLTTSSRDSSFTSTTEETSATTPTTSSQDPSFSSTIQSASVTTPTMPNPHFLAHGVYPPLPLAFFQPDNTRILFNPSDDIIASDFFTTHTDSSEFQASLEQMAFPLFDDYIFQDNLISPLEIHFPPKDFRLSDPTRSLEQTSKPGQPSGNYSTVNNKSMPSIDSIEDAILLAYYFEKVFSWQFQFCQFQVPEFNQGHILWLVFKSRSLHQAVLALSSSHKGVWKDFGCSSACLTNNEHTPQYNLAIKELQNDLQDPSSYKEIWLLACIVMFLYSTLLHKSRSVDWQLHLEAGTFIVTSWVEQNCESLSPCQIDGEQESEANVIESARVFLIGSILRFDILSSLTRDSPPALSGQYQRVLQTSRYGIRLEAVLGCRNWPLNTLLDLYSLRDWKERTKAAGTLSLRELMRKAHPIKESLESDILLNLEEMTKHKQELEGGNSGDGDPHSDYDILVVTHIFACAVSVFLEVIVSGALPKLPEIKHEVCRAIESYAYINNPDLLHVLRWPLYVTGCVAELEHHDFFRSLLSSPNVARVGTFSESLELLEECWQINEDVRNTEAGFEFTRVQKLMSQNYLIV